MSDRKPKSFFKPVPNPYVRIAFAQRVMTPDNWLAFYSAFNAIHPADAVIPDIRKHHFSRAVEAGIVFG